MQLVQEAAVRFAWRIETASEVIILHFRNGQNGFFSNMPNPDFWTVRIPEQWQKEFEKRIATPKNSTGEYIFQKSKAELIWKFFNNVDAPLKSSQETALEKFRNGLQGKEKTEKLQLIKSRRGQKTLRDYLIAKYHKCVVTGISEPELLIASHIKPWSECDDDELERLDENNVLLLSVSLDKLFDAHFISFSPADGSMTVSDKISKETLRLLGVAPDNMKIPQPSSEQAKYLQYHNERLK